MQQANWIDTVLAMPWIAWSLGGLLLGLGFWLAYRFLFADRARGRRRCPKCWYDLRGIADLRCPECGHAAKSERALFRTRRRWRAAVGALLLAAIGAGVASAPNYRNGAWAKLVPTTVLLWLMPPCEGPASRMAPNWAQRELDRRNAAASMSESQWQYVLLEKGGLRFRKAWPADTPLTVDASGANWCRSWRTNIHEASLGPAPGKRAAVGISRARTAPPTSDRAARFVVSIDPTAAFVNRSQRPPATPEATPFWKGEIELPIRIVPTIDDVMTPRSGSEFDELIRRAVQVQVITDLHGTALRCVLDRSIDQRLAKLAYAFEITVRRGAEFERTFGFEMANVADPRLRGGPARGSSVVSSRMTTNLFTVSDLQNTNDWTFELSGAPERALCDWDQSDFWRGCINLNAGEVWVEGRDSSGAQRAPE